MDIVFTGGNSEQRALWREALENLLNLPLEALPLTQNVAFVKPSQVDPAETGDSTPFAATYWEEEAKEGEVKVRKDAPGFGDDDAGLIAEAQAMGLTYNARQHFHETAAHETGHCVFASLPEEFRLKIAGLFGAKTIEREELFPVGKEWKDRIGEAIAETFKEAFLPSRYRVFPNRTNIILTYARYPLFRRLVREGIEAIEGVGGTQIIPAYNFDALKRESPEVFHGNETDVDGNSGLWRDYFSDLIGGNWFNEGIERFEEGGEVGWRGQPEDPGFLFEGDLNGRLLAGRCLLDYWILDGATLHIASSLPSDFGSDQTPTSFPGPLSGVPILDETSPPGGETLWPSRTPFRSSWEQPLDLRAMFETYLTHPPSNFSATTEPRQVKGYEWRKTVVPEFLLTHGIAERTGGPDDSFTPTRELYDWPVDRVEGDGQGIWTEGVQHYMWFGELSYGDQEFGDWGFGPVKPNGRVDGFWCYYDATDLSMSDTYPVNHEWFPETKECNGKTYRRVRMEFRMTVYLPGGPKPIQPVDPNAGEEEGGPSEYEPLVKEMFDRYMRAWMPTLVLKQKRCAEGESPGGGPIALPAGSAEAAGPRGGNTDARHKLQAHHGGAVAGKPLPPWKAAAAKGHAFCYPYFSDEYPDESGNDWPARHLGARDHEAFVLYPDAPDFNDGTYGVDMSQFAESSHKAYSIAIEEGGTS